MQRIKLEDKKITRGASLLLCCAMMFSPMRAVAFSGNVPVEGGGLCAHHPEHTAACGYYDLIEGTACTHEHSEECYTDIQACIHEHTAGCAGVTEASNAAEVPSGAAGDMTDGDAQPAACTHTCSEETGCVTETLNCAHEAGEHDGDCGYTAGAPAGVCRYACAVCPIQARIDALPGPDAIAAMDEAAWEALWQEIESLNEAIGALAEADKASLDPSKLTAISAALTADEKHVIDRDSATLKGWGWMIEKDSENHFTLRIPGVTEGTPLPFTNPGNDAASFIGIFGGINFTANSGNINIFSSEKGPTLNANQSGNFAELQAVADANGGNLPVGKYDMEFKLSKLGGTVNGAFPDTKKEDFIFENGDDFFTLTVILGTEPGDDTPFDQYTIQTVSPSNVNFTLFDYWIYKQTTHDHPNDGKKTVSVIPTCGNPACIGENKHVTPDKDKDGDIIDDSRAESFFSAGINQDHALVFGPTGSRDDENDTLGDWNSPTGTGGAVQGIVANKLNEEGYPVLDLDPAEVRQKKFINGRDENESLKYLFSLEENDFKSVYENANGLLKIDPETGNYKYNSLENFASYFEEEGSFKVYEKPAVKAGANERGQFFPFNQPSQVFAIEDGELKEKQMREFSGSEFTTTPHLPDGGIDAFFNHYFGMTMEVKFQQPPKGKISNAANAKDMIFTFAGDDDVWIFIDGVLVADLGGIHDAMGVEINFATGEIKIDRKDRFNNQNAGPTRVNSTIKKQFKTAGVNTAAGFNGDTFGDNTVHELKMFYIERGNFASNLDISFNLMEPEFSHIVKVDQKGDGLSGVEFKLYEATDKFEVAEDAVALATLVTGEGGTVDFVTYDEADKPIPIAFKPDQNYVLREVKTRDGFVTTGDIHLSYTEDTGLLEVKNQWNTGATAGFEARVTQPGNLKFANGDDAGIKGQEGLVLAVPMFNPIHKGSQEKYGWRPLYGSVTEGFHMVEVKSEDAEGYRSAALQAALLQLDNPRNERWYLEYSQENMRFEGLLRDMPGSADRYVFVNPEDGDMITAYYLLDPSDDIFDGCSTSKEKLDKLVEKLDGMSEAQREQYFRDQQGNMKLLDINQFNRQFYTRLYIPNQVRELRVHKQDEAGEPLAGAVFTLYSDEDCMYAVAKGVTDEKGDISFSAQNTGRNAVNGGEPSSNVQFALTREDTADGRQARSYWLKETEAPDGYRLNTAATEIRITDDSLYANAGSADNGVSVRKGVGHLIQTMVRYAADDKLNVTLRDIIAIKYTYDAATSGKELPDFERWEAANDEPPLNLHYGLESALLDYGLHDANRQPYFVADEGWLGFGVKQNYTAHQNDGSEWAMAGGTKEDIEDEPISALLTGTTTVVVTDEREPDTGSLKISKTVSGSGGDTSRKFMFTVELADGGNAPVSGAYGYTGGSVGQASAPVPGSLTFDENGRACFALSHGQSITISGLPVGTHYSVAESDYDDYMVTVTGGAVGTIQKDITAAVAFENHKDDSEDGGEDGVHVTVKKVWKLDDGGAAAASVTVSLLKDGKLYDTVVLDGGNGWTHTWTGLCDGCIWSVMEADVPDGFAMSVEQSGHVFTITNDDVGPPAPPEETDPPEPAGPPEQDGPNDSELQTGDVGNPLLWIIALVISGLGMVTTLILGKKKKCGPKHLK